jgi:hypothetical protein
MNTFQGKVLMTLIRCLSILRTVLDSFYKGIALLQLQGMQARLAVNLKCL